MSKKPLARNFSEGCELIWIRLKVSWINFIEFLKVAVRYYRNPLFAKIDLFLQLQYLLQSPYTTSKRFLLRSGAENIYAYGETPLTTVDAIASRCGLSERDHLFELGCGRGRSCFWLHCFTGCRVTGIDCIGLFIKKAEKIRARFKLEKIEFIEGDFFSASLEEATVIYLYGTDLEEEEILKLIERFAALPQGTKLITVSYPLTDYTSKGGFVVIDRFEASFTWGNADVYLQIKQ